MHNDYASLERDALARRARRHAELLARVGPPERLGFGFQHFGFTHADDGVWVREWLPGARAVSLVGDLNGWDRTRHPLARDERGIWSLRLDDDPMALHGTRAKLHVVGADGSERDRIPAYARRVVQEGEGDFTPQFWFPEPYAWRNPVPPLDGGLRIYEAHVGMALEDGRIGTFAEFERSVLPRIAALGYDAVQLMAIQEHPYYGSFGYHVSSFFAASSRFGTPEDLKSLIDAAHGLGLRVLLDLVHSHAVRNLNEGLDRLDGSDHLYFRGVHPAWDSMTFDYGRGEVQDFLLSNVRFWLEEFRFDGFRFDGVTSVVYRDHGLGRTFGALDDYFGPNVDEDALDYLSLANDLAHAVRPDAITIAEDVSGMPGMARPTVEGGLGFDYRLAMGVPDFWVELLKEKPDEVWHLGDLWHALLDRRAGERHVGYAESHDQSLVGDQTLAFRLMGAAMYSDMERGRRPPVVDRGLALHKLVRLLTFTLASEAWLSFMGNEFGHPEWVDFPREGNGWSHHYARRQWSLADNPFLHYGGLNAFDAALMRLDREYGTLDDPFIELLRIDEARKLMVYRRGPLVFAVNLHPTESYADLPVPAPDPFAYRVVLASDEERYAGLGRAAEGTRHLRIDGEVRVYLPSRTALVLAPESDLRP